MQQTTRTDPPRPGRLALEDGTVFHGLAFGAVGKDLAVAAEVVFNTAMQGYQESLTDPSYSGQILVATFPLIGNYGINEEDVESSRVQASGFVVRELARRHSNYRATTDLSTYLANNNILGLADVDTRALTRRLRTAGVMRGVITDRADLSDDQLVGMAKNAPDMSGQNLVPAVGCTSDMPWSEDLGEWDAAVLQPESGEADLTVLAIDCGAKRNILRNLTERGCRVLLVPHTITADQIRQRFESGEVQGLFVSNGPGDPAAVESVISTLRQLVRADTTIPTFGICLGHQLLALALGAKSFKLKFGHRGINQPVLNKLTGEVEITSQNHGFAIDPDSITALGGVPTHFNLNDNTLAGFTLADRPVLAVQHHPEASPGPHDAGYLFDAFVRMMKDRKPVTPETMRRFHARA